MIYYICACTAIILSVFLTVIYFRYGNKFQTYMKGIDKKDYFLTGIFYIGFACISIFHINMNSKRANSRRKVIAELKGGEYAQFYYFANLAGQISYGLICLTLAFLIAALSKDITLCLVFIVVGIILIWYLDYDIDSKLKKKNEAIMLEFPRVLSKMALLVNAGMPVRETFKKIAYNQEGIIYGEINRMLSEMTNGVPERKALSDMAERCGISEIRKFTSTLAQNLQKGSADTARSLVEMNEEIWANRTSHVREMGEKASAKLLIPILLIFVGILAMVMVPMFANIL